MAGIDFSSYRLNVFLFPVHPIAQEKGPIASRFKKFFQFFSEAHHPKVDRLLCQAGFLSDFIPVVAGHLQKGDLDGELVLLGKDTQQFHSGI